MPRGARTVRTALARRHISHLGLSAVVVRRVVGVAVALAARDDAEAAAVGRARAGGEERRGAARAAPAPPKSRRSAARAPRSSGQRRAAERGGRAARPGPRRGRAAARPASQGRAARGGLRRDIVYSSVPQAARRRVGDRARAQRARASASMSGPRTRSCPWAGTRSRTPAPARPRAAGGGAQRAGGTRAASARGEQLHRQDARGVGDDPRRLAGGGRRPWRRGPPCRPRWGWSRRSRGGRAPCSRRRGRRR